MSTSDLSLILSIAIPSTIGLVLLIFIIVCFKNKCGKGKSKLSKRDGVERPIIIHLSNDASERMQIKDGDNLNSIQRLGYCTPPRTTATQLYPLDNYPHTNHNHHNRENQLEAPYEWSIQKNRLFTYQTPDKNQRKIPRPPITSITKQKTHSSHMTRPLRNYQNQNQQTKMSKIEFTNEDHNDWDNFTPRNNYTQQQYYSNPQKKIKINNNSYQKPKIASTNIKQNSLPCSLLNSNDHRYEHRLPIHPKLIHQRENISNFDY